MSTLDHEEFPIQGSSIPLLPLPNLFLIPGSLLPLHIFEARYRDLVQALLDSTGRLVLGTVLGGEEDESDESSADESSADEAAVEPLAGLGYLENYQLLPDGRYLILVRGLARVSFTEKESDRSYRLVDYLVVEDVPVPDGERNELEHALRDAISNRAGEYFELPDGLRIGQLADLLLMHLKLPPARMSELLQLKEVSHRARRILDLHDTLPDN